MTALGVSRQQNTRQNSSSASVHTIVEKQNSPAVESGKALSRHDNYPDGGIRAWLVVVGAMCTGFSTLGMVVTWGVFQAYYEETLLRHESPSTIAWIGSIQFACVFLPGMFSGRLLDSGHFRIPLCVSSILYVVSFFITAQCTTLYQFILSQGLLEGLASGCLFAPAMSVLSHWFNTRRALAFSFFSVGGSVGGVVLPITTRTMLQNGVSFPWTMRALGFIFLGTLAIANLTLRTRLPPHPSGPLIPFAAFKSPAYALYCLSAFLMWLGIYTPLTYLEISGVKAGLTPAMAFGLIPIVNGLSLVGRLAAGALAVKYGPMNVLIPATVLVAVMVYAWPFCTSLTSLVIFSVIYGTTSGVFAAVLPAPIPRMGDPRTIGSRIGVCMTLMSFGALAGPPISGAIETATGGFTRPAYFAGTSVVVACLCAVGARWFALNGKWMGKI